MAKALIPIQIFIADLKALIRQTDVSQFPENGSDMIADAVRTELDLIDGPDGARGTTATECVEYIIASLQLSLGRIPDGSDEADLTCVDCGHEVESADELDEEGRCVNCRERVIEQELEEEEEGEDGEGS